MRLRFRTKIYACFFSLLLIQGLILFFWISQVMKGSFQEEIKSRGTSIGISLSARIVEPILARDFLRMRDLVDETVQLGDDIFYTFVLDENGSPLIHTFNDGFPTALKTANTVDQNQKGSMKVLDTGDHLIYDYAVPIVVNEERLGTIRLGLYQTKVEKALKKILISAVITIAATILAAGIVGTLLLNPVTRRIKRLHESSEQALKGNLDVRTAPILKKNCWDMLDCQKADCPAYENYHRRCWYLAGTLCPECVEGVYAKKIDSCRQCRVYKHLSGDEIQSLAESFDAMTLSLKGNLSDLKSAEHILNEQKALLQTILDAIPDFISLQDHEGRYISVNKAFCDILNTSGEKILGKLNDDLFPSGHAQIFNREDKTVRETGLPLDKENKLTGPKGTRWIHVLKIPVAEENGRVKGLVCSGRDITQLKAVQEQLTHAQKMESVGRLAAGVAHEINTPLGIILGYAQLILEDIEKESLLHNDMITIVKQTKICSRIVADLLEFSRTGESSTSEFNMNDAVEEVLSVVEHTFGLNHVTIERAFADTPLLIKGDKEKIKQVVVNLLNNSFDAIGGNGCIDVATGIGGAEDKIRLTITDSGPGIGKENLTKIFEPFFTTKGPDKGTGLGLSVTFGIVEEHGGTIKVFSPPRTGKKIDQGTQFIVELSTGLNPITGALNGKNSRT